MIVALPCISFSYPERQIIMKYGFLTYPEFIDNFYVRHRTRKFAYFRRLLVKYRDLIRFAVLPDYDYELMERLVVWDSRIQWLMPIHLKREIKIADKLGVKWIAMPYRRAWRDYDVNWFLDQPYSHWLLGFWDEGNPHIILRFDGFDTTIPEYYSGKCGKIWITWGKAVKPKTPMKTIEKFEINVRNLKKAIENLLKQEVIFNAET